MAIAPKREWRPTGDQYVKMEFIVGMATTTQTASPSTTTSPQARVCLGA